MTPIKRYLALFCVGNLFIFTYFLLFDSMSDTLKNYFQYFQQWHNNTIIDESSVENPTCKLPKFSPWDPLLLPYVQHPKEVTCRRVQPDLTYLTDNGTLCFNDTELSTQLKKSAYCEYAYFDRGKRDRDLVFESAKKISISAKCLRLAKPFMQISCYSNTSKLSLIYADIHAHPVLTTNENPHKFRKSDDSEDQLNVLLFALESTSRGMVHRHLPTTRKYLTETMRALEFRSFLKVGENTMPNLVPIFTGLRARNEENNEMATEIAKDKEGFYDHYPMIWKNFSRLGYVTSYIEDYSHIGTFHYSGNGFRTKPVDLWYFPFWEALRKATMPRKSSQFCFGNKPMAAVFVDAVRRHVIALKNRYYFTFGIFSDLSHDFTSDLERADRELYGFFRQIHEGDYLNRTLLIFMGDHGPRYTQIRPTVAGYIEERNSALFLRMPPWFQRKYPKIYANLKTNANRLISPFDLHETLLDILNRNFSKIDRPKAESRGRSLLYPIPTQRTCRQAGVPSYYCLCQGVKILNTSNMLIFKIAKILVDAINNMTAKKRDICSAYHFQTINYALEVADQKFRNQSSSTLSILVSVNVLPYAKFEGLLSVDFERETITPHTNRFERINRFFGRGTCANSIQESKFCTCKSLIPDDERQLLLKLNLKM